MRVETQRWWRQATEDLETARVTLAGERWPATSFFAQRVIEKAVKAVLVERQDNQLPRTDGLVALARCVGAPETIKDKLAGLTGVCVVAWAGKQLSAPLQRRWRVGSCNDMAQENLAHS